VTRARLQGKGGLTRRKIARAAHCVIQYVGSVAFIAGRKEERGRARDYLDVSARAAGGAGAAAAIGRTPC
jgi:hypothetical protein